MGLNRPRDHLSGHKDDTNMPKVHIAKRAIIATLETGLNQSCYFFQQVIAMSNDDRQKMEDIRKFSAIYGRFDCKRKPEKPLTLHEVRSDIFCFYNLTRWRLARQICLICLIVIIFL